MLFDEAAEKRSLSPTTSGCVDWKIPTENHLAISIKIKNIYILGQRLHFWEPPLQIHLNTIEIIHVQGYLFLFTIQKIRKTQMSICSGWLNKEIMVDPHNRILESCINA